MDFSRNDPTHLLGAYLRRQFPTGAAKQTARVADCDPRTAEGYVEGRRWPNARHWARLAATFGADITDAVFHPEAAAERLQRECDVLAQELETKRAAARALTGLAQADRPRTTAGNR